MTTLTLIIAMTPFTVPLPSTALMGACMLGAAAALIRSPAHKRRIRRGLSRGASG